LMRLLSKQYNENYYFSEVKSLDNWYEFMFPLKNKTIIDVFNEMDVSNEIHLIYFKRDDNDDVIVKIDTDYKIPDDLEMHYFSDKLYVQTKSFGLIEIQFTDSEGFFELKVKDSNMLESILSIFESSLHIEMYN